MERAKREIRLDAYARFCLGAVLVLLAAMAVGVWAQQEVLPAAVAASPADDDGFGNPSGERKAMVKAQMDTNAKLDELIRLLKSGEVKVQVGDKGAGDAPKK